MRIFDVDEGKAGEAPRLTPHLVADEIVHILYVSTTGLVIFTDRRILIVQREHLLEERVETSSYPYRSVRHFSIQEGAEGFSQMRIWLGEEEHPLHLRARPGADLGPLQHLLARQLA
jgi:hypothetical protein